MAGQEGRPEVVEAREPGGDDDLAHFHLAEPGVLEQPAEHVGPGDGESAALVEVGCTPVDLDGRIPEAAEHLHALGVVPDVRGDRASGPGHACHLADARRRLRDEVEHQPRQR